MSRTESNFDTRVSKERGVATEFEYEKWMHWPVNWTAVVIGALAALAVILVVSLIAIAVGAQLTGPRDRLVDLKSVGLSTLLISIFGSFLAFVVGGWVACKIAGILHSEPAMLHGAIVWLVAVPLVAVLVSLGVGGYSAGWYSGLGNRHGTMAEALDRPDYLASPSTVEARAQYEAAWKKYHDDVARWREESPKAARNSALCAITALLLGLMGSVVGGWMGCGEPMTLTYHRTRPVFAARS
jgi:hypothetical protein